ncbi:MAG: repeat protein [Proteobacteria bacterium]|nr:repeat protein [Pseudomonadota bacterium]
MKLDEDLTIDEGCHPQALDAAASSDLDAARLMLAEGNWAEGFVGFERRPFVSPSGRPRWNGARLPAARVVVLAEEAECNTLAFARFLPRLAARVLSLVLAAPAAQLARLSSFAAAFGNLPVVDVAALPSHDFVLPLASAPAALGLSPEDVPPPRALPLSRRTEETIGLAFGPSPWGGGSEMTPESVMAVLRQAFPTFRLVALDQAAARHLGGQTVESNPTPLVSLDLVVATDGHVAHAAGVVGAPLWLLLDDKPHWMWGRQGHFSRWYPTARLFRAAGLGWQGVASALAAEAKALAAPGLSNVAALNRLVAVAESVDGAPAARAALPFAARLVALAPADPGAWARLAGLLFRLGETTDADGVLDAGLAAGPRHAPLLLLAAGRDLNRGEAASALHRVELALVVDPTSIEALTSRAAAFAALGEPGRAEFALRQAVQAAPRRADLLVSWGEALRGLGDARGASRAFERAVLVEDGADARLGLGRLAAAAGETGLALHFFQSAVARDGGHSEAAVEFARALTGAGRTREAIGVLRRLVARCPSPPAHTLLGELLLASGDFAAGLAEFEWRHGELRLLPSLADLAGRDLVLTAEGNAGAMIRFLRFVPTIKASGAASVRIAGADDLLPLLARVDGLDAARDIKDGDLVVPVMSLPALLGITPGNLPAPRRYLAVDPVAVTNAARAFAHLEGFRIGLALDGWSESIDISPLAELTGVAFIALDAKAAERLPDAWPLATDRSGLDKVAAALPNLDAVVAPAGSPVAALAGAAGRPAFVIGPDRDDWLWLEKDGRTPWFPATRLFRRRPEESEANRLSRLVTVLAAFAVGDRAVPFRADPAPIVDVSLKGEDLSDRPRAALVRAGLAALASRDNHRAILLLGDAIAIGNAEPELREKLAAALLRMGERDRAGSLLATLVAEAPTAERLVELSEVERLTGRFEEALAHAERAVERKSDLARAHRGVGKALVALGRASEALGAYGHAVALAPADPELTMDEAEALLIAGDYRRGFARAEVRWRAAELLPRRFAAPRWTGEDISGRTLLVHGERDLGLDIAFARFLPRLMAHGARLILEVRPALTDLFRRLDLGGNVTVVEQGRRLPPYDLEVPLRSLPHVFGTERTDLPAIARFQPDSLRVEAWRRLVGGDGRPAVGVYWRNAADATRLARLATLDGVRLFALDRRAGRASLAALPKELSIESLGDRLGGFVETAAALAALDAVVAPVSTTAHLAATLGRPTLVIDPSGSDWLWAGEDTTPWYPQVRILRRSGDLAGLLRGLLTERPAL